MNYEIAGNVDAFYTLTSFLATTGNQLSFAEDRPRTTQLTSAKPPMFSLRPTGAVNSSSGFEIRSVR